MADYNVSAPLSYQFDELIATTYNKVKPVLADQITHECALLAALNSKARVTVDGGLTIRRPVLYGYNDTVGTYSGYDLIDTTPQDGFGYVEYPWAQYAGSVTISGEDERKNMGSAQIINLLQAKIEQLRLSVEDDMNAMLWTNGTPAAGTATGNGGKDFLSIAAIVGDGLTEGFKTLGGIGSDADDAGRTWWRSRVAATCDLSTIDGVTTLNHMLNGLKLAKSKPDFEFTDQDSFEAYEALAAPFIRFTSTSMAELGFESVAHKSAEVVFETDSPDGKWYFINSQYLEFVQHSAAWMKMLDFVRPANQDAKTALVISMGNLITDVRRAHGVITAVTT